MSGGSGAMTYSANLDGSRTLMQPPFTVRGIIISNRTNQALTLTDGRASSWTARPGATAQYVPVYPDDNYIATLAVTPGVATTGQCTLTFTPYAIEEKGESAVAGPLQVTASQLLLLTGQLAIFDTLGGIAVHLTLASDNPTYFTVRGRVKGLGNAPNASGPLIPGPLLVQDDSGGAGQLTIRIGAGTSIPLPDQIVVSAQLPANGGNCYVAWRLITQ